MTTYFDEDGNPVEIDDRGPAGLRKELKERSDELENLKSQLNELLSEKRAVEVENVLKDFNPKVKELVNEFNLDAKVVAEKYGDLFGAPAPEAPTGDEGGDPNGGDPAAALAAQFAAMQELQQGAEPAGKQVTQQEDGLLKAAGDLKNPADITAYMRSIGAAV